MATTKRAKKPKTVTEVRTKLREMTVHLEELLGSIEYLSVRARPLETLANHRVRIGMERSIGVLAANLQEAHGQVAYMLDRIEGVDD